MARSRAPCDLSPWMARPSMPALVRIRAMRSAPCLVRENTSTELSGRSRSREASSVRFSAFSANRTALADGLDHRGRGRHGDVRRVAEHRIGQFYDVVGHRRREEERLPLCGQQREDSPDVVDETHVEHSVGFVEDEEADVGQRDVTLADQVEQASRRGVPAGRCRVAAHRPAAAGSTPPKIDAVADVRVAGIVAAAFVDLDRQLARRREHQRLDRAPPFGARLGREQLEDRQREGRRLARPGLGAAQQVAAFQWRAGWPAAGSEWGSCSLFRPRHA